MAVLRWIADGCPDEALEPISARISAGAYAAQHRFVGSDPTRVSTGGGGRTVGCWRMFK